MVLSQRTHSNVDGGDGVLQSKPIFHWQELRAKLKADFEKQKAKLQKECSRCLSRVR